jgi:hypothetical protein
MAKEIEIRSQRIWLDDDGIIHAELRAHVDVGLEDAREAIRSIGTICGERRKPVLVDIRDIKSMSRDARVYFAGEETAKFESAVALLLKSPLTRAIGNFFLGLNKTLFPTRLFTDEEEALSWLRSFLPRES